MKRFVRPVVVLIALPIVAFGALWAFHKASWILYPYPPGADGLQTSLLWAKHVLTEKAVSRLICFVIGAAVFLLLSGLRPKTRLAFSVIVAFVLEAMLISRYILMFGVEAYQDYNSLANTLLSTFALSFLGGGIPYLVVMRRTQKGIE